ncbi:hypothetical protein [Kitasatospora sp. LaBMicrA B282]|uniref:hypothetical protein n=1 Tax=Kitasatospora sp. LaBMicrA B282 TaxID=3420949 RepID=UPI003D0CF9CC
MRKWLAIALGVGVLGLAGLVAAVFLVPGATGGRARPDQLVGAWSGDQDARLTLRPDGTLDAVALPTDLSVPDHRPVDPFTGAGTWTLEPKHGPADQELRLVLATPQGRTGLRVLIKGDGADGGIYLPGDEDAGTGFVLHRSP